MTLAEALQTKGVSKQQIDAAFAMADKYTGALTSESSGMSTLIESRKKLQTITSNLSLIDSGDVIITVTDGTYYKR